MKLVIITRHQGLVEYLEKKGLTGKTMSHLAGLDELDEPSLILGVLPLHLAVRAINAGHRYVSVSLDLPSFLRGQELTAEQVEEYASLLELQLQWRRLDMDWQCDAIECRTGIPEPSAGDMQEFRVGLVPRSVGDIVSALEGYDVSHPRYGVVE